MLTRLATQEMVDGLSAVALGASVLVVLQRRSASALRWRLGLALGGLCLFFGVRAASEALGSRGLNLLDLEIVSLLPVAALVLAEGVLRRHAPWMLKALVTAGAVAMTLGLIIIGDCAPVSTSGLAGYVIASMAGFLVLLLARDRSSLSRQENASVGALIAAGVLLTLLSLTDFLPQAPVGLSGVGAAALAFVVGAGPASSGEARRGLTRLLAIVLAAAVCALLFAGPLGLATVIEQVRLAALLLALLLSAAVALSAHQRAMGEADGFASALADADTTSLDAFLDSLAGQPLLAGLRIAEGAQLADYDEAGLTAAMAVRAVWSRGALSEAGDATPQRARDELADLMDRADASHAVMISRSPLRIAAFTLPGVGSARETETDLALFHKLAVIASREQP
jgi:hypothetical protein